MSWLCHDHQPMSLRKYLECYSQCRGLACAGCASRKGKRCTHQYRPDEIVAHATAVGRNLEPVDQFCEFFWYFSDLYLS